MHHTGHGVYTYENQFFRYEGHWENGLKHGHGKLTLGDGGYYEGAFVRGEIEGHGYRVYGLSGSTYSGQFHRGELHGQGLLRTAGGGQYEGSWVYGKKEGERQVPFFVYEDGYTQAVAASLVNDSGLVTYLVHSHISRPLVKWPHSQTVWERGCM